MEKATESLKHLKTNKLRKLKINKETTKDNKEQKIENKHRNDWTGYSFERNCVPCGNLPYGQFAG